ncbi:unnamed protein product, partial [Polarella glacialis]
LGRRQKDKPDKKKRKWEQEGDSDEEPAKPDAEELERWRLEEQEEERREEQKRLAREEEEAARAARVHDALRVLPRGEHREHAPLVDAVREIEAMLAQRPWIAWKLM